MHLRIYQAYHDPSTVDRLESEFIPFDNTNDNKVQLEYAVWLKLFERNQTGHAHWGSLSWRWREKTGLEGKLFANWIQANPGHDVYFFDPGLILLDFDNLWIQGEQWHPGIIDYANRLLPKLGYNFDIRKLEYTGDDFMTANYFIGNSNFWSRYLGFLEKVIDITKNDPDLNRFMFETGTKYRGRIQINFIFIVERLFPLFCMFNPDIKVKKYPYESFCYQQLLGTDYLPALESYYRRQKRIDEILQNRRELL